MAELTPREPQSATDYDDRTTTAVKSVLIEIGQILGSFKGKFAVVGGAVPWLLLNNEVMPHVGSLDVDLTLDAEALGDGEYATLIDALQGQGYEQRKELRRFQLVRKVPAKDGGAPIDIIVDFLMPRDAEIVKNNPPLLDNFAVQRADGADLALRFYQMVAIDGPMPSGRNEPRRDRGLLHSRPARHERSCLARPPQAERRLRYLLLHPELSRRDQRTR
jgi:hypothetical protein